MDYLCLLRCSQYTVGEGACRLFLFLRGSCFIRILFAGAKRMDVYKENEVDFHHGSRKKRSGSPPLSGICENERKLGSRIAVLPCMVKSHSHSSMKTACGQRPCSAHPSLTTTRHQLDEAVHTM